MKYFKAFFFWFFIMALGFGANDLISSVIGSGLGLSQEAVTNLAIGLKVPVVVIVTIWTRRKIKSGWFGD
jgi:hypothetical protein